MRLTLEKNKQISDLIQKNKEGLEELTQNKDKDKEIVELHENHQASIDTLAREIDGKTSTLEQTHKAALEELNKTKTNIEEISQEKDQQITHLIQNNEAESTQLVQEKDKKLSDLKAANKSELTRLTHTINEHNSHLNDKDNIIKNLEADLHQEKAKVASLELENDKKQNEIDKQTQTINSKNEETIEMDGEILEPTKQNAQLLEQVNFIKTNTTSTVERLTLSNEEAMKELKSIKADLSIELKNSKQAQIEKNKLMEQLLFVKESSASTVERLTRSVESSFDRIKELESKQSKD